MAEERGGAHGGKARGGGVEGIAFVVRKLHRRGAHVRVPSVGAFWVSGFGLRVLG